MRHDHFSMLPERAFQPRCGRFGMTLEGGGGGFIGDVVSSVTGAISDLGSAIDDAVNDVIPGGWGTVAATTILLTTGIPTDFGATEAALASEAAAAGATAAPTAAEYAALADAFGTGATAASVPSAFEAATTAGGLLGESTLGSAGPIGTGGFGTALAPASELAAGLEVAGFAPGTAANLAGTTAAGVGATNLLGGATALAPVSAAPATISVQQALQGARLANNLLNPQQPQTPNLLNRAQELLKTQGAVDYTSLLGLLNQRAQTSGLLGTRYQPQSINLASLLG